MDFLKTLKEYKILYCEDNKDLMMTFKILLKDKTDNILYAENGEAGLKLYHDEKPDIIITDIEMPEVNGMEMIKIIRLIDNETPIVITTSHEDQKYLIDSIDAGVNKFLIKPIKKDFLLATLEDIVINLDNKKMADEYRAKLELEKMRENVKEVITQFSQVFVEPIMILQNKKIKYANEAFEKTIGSENMKLLLDDISRFDNFLEEKEGFFSAIENLCQQNSYENKISLRINGKRRIYQVIVKKLNFKGEVDESDIYVFQDITIVEYQKLKIQNYSLRLEDYLIASKYKRKNTTNKPLEKIDSVLASTVPLTGDEEVITLPTEEKKRTLSSEDAALLRKTHVDKTSAKEFLSTLDASLTEDLDELKEIEEEIDQELYDFFEKPSKDLLNKVISKFDHYAYAIKKMQEFDELAQALFSTKNVLSSIETLEDKTIATIRVYLEGIFSDLKQWRDTIFVVAQTKDIHYLDASLFSSCLQLELTLTGIKPDDDEDDFELF